MNPSKTLLGLLFLGVFFYAVAGESHGETCGPSTHCDVDVGLICHETKCACGNGTLTKELQFQMTWDAGRATCVGTASSACVGTRANPVPQGMKQVPCVSDRVCVQEPNMPLGVGSCQVEDTFFAPGGHGADCGPHTHCAINVGLICHEKKCACGNGTLTKDIPFQMTWDEGRFLCVATPETACIGTSNTPVKSGTKAVRCASGYSCFQQPNLPQGVGTCKSAAGGGSDTPSTDGAESLTKHLSVMTFVAITTSILMMNKAL